VGRPARGFSLLELAVVSVLLSILLAVYLERLSYYQEAAERAQFQATLQTYKTALQIRLAQMMVARREVEAHTLEIENPTRWLAQPPANYGGEYPAQPRPGTWYFDAAARELVYVVNSGGGLVVGGKSGVRQLRFRVQVVYQKVEVAGTRVRAIGGIALSPGAPYRWL
jgi:prepilin-type N-terminal cleavage/methylation domain-containing protein